MSQSAPSDPTLWGLGRYWIALHRHLQASSAPLRFLRLALLMGGARWGMFAQLKVARVQPQPRLVLLFDAKGRNLTRDRTCCR